MRPAGDDDGYITGERVRIHDPKHLYFTEIDGTWAYLGDPFVPNFFARAERLGQNNYQQYLAKKQFGTRVVASADYTRLRASNTLREAVKVKAPEMHVFDSARLEFYQRTNDQTFYGVRAAAGWGFAASVSKQINRRLGTEVGFASIDDHYASYSGSTFLEAVGLAWNSDSFVIGKRPYVRLNYKVAQGLTFMAFFTHKTAGAYSINHQGLNAGFNFDLAELMHAHNIL